MTIEVKVQEKIKVFDRVNEAEDYVIEKIEDWFDSDTTIPLTIELTKIEDRGPPDLGVSVADKLDLKERLG